VLIIADFGLLPLRGGFVGCDAIREERFERAGDGE
jgi:hypothetical protein